MKNNSNTEIPFVAIGTETKRTSTEHPNFSVQPSHISEPLPNPPNNLTLHDQLNFGTPIGYEETGLLTGITEAKVVFIDPTVFKNNPSQK